MTKATIRRVKIILWQKPPTDGRPWIMDWRSFDIPQTISRGIHAYLKSQAIPLHGDAIVTNPKDWKPIGRPASQTEKGSRNVLFRPFIGVAPRLYRRAFFKDRDLKNNLTGDIVTTFGEADGHATTDTLRVSYAQVEAKLADLTIEASQ